MKRRILAMTLAAALALSLTACGGGTKNNSSASEPGGSSDGSIPATPVVVPNITLNKTEITLNKAGGTFQLKYTTDPEINATPIYGSSNTVVATVDGTGTITAVSPGGAVITVECGGATAACTVTCDWEEEAPDTSKPVDTKPAGDTSKPANDKPIGDPVAPASGVDLSDFYTTTTGKYEFGMLALADNDILDALYAGLTGIGLEQMQVYYCPMSMNNGEFCLVQVKDGKDVDAVKAIFQARIDYMVGDGNGPGGAQYPMAMDSWENNSRIVSNGNYVMMVVHENCDDIVSDFNALF